MKRFKNSKRKQVDNIKYGSITEAIQAILIRDSYSNGCITPFKAISAMLNVKMPYVTYAYKKAVKEGKIADTYKGERGFKRKEVVQV